MSEIERDEEFLEQIKKLQEDEANKIYFYRIDFVRLNELIYVYLRDTGIRRVAFLDTCENPTLYKKMLDEGFPVTGRFIEELDSFLSNRNEEGVLIRDEEMKSQHIYLNKNTHNFTVNGVDEERTKIFPIEYEFLGNPDMVKSAYNEYIK